MRSRVARDLFGRRLERLGSMTPDERVAMAARLTEASLTSYMATHGIDRRTAIPRIKATHRNGRRHSACAVADE
jgi:hypothetical protein